MALKDILTSGTYADDMVLSLPDGTTATVGEMRSMAATERAALLQRSKDLETAEQGVMQRVTTLRNAGLLDDQMQPITQRQVERHVAEATGMDEDDPLFGPLVRQTRAEIAAIKTAAETEITGLKNQVAQIGNATRQAMQGYLGDHYSATFSREQAALPEAIRSKVTLEQAVKYATDRKLMDDVGRLDISAAVDRLTWEPRKESERAALEAKGAEVAEQRKSLAAMQRPGFHGPSTHGTGFKTTDDKGRTLSLDEAIAAAGNDDQIWASAAQFVN